jgi:hypothetical protein
MSDARSRIIAGLGGIAAAAALKWIFDRWLWDVAFRGLVHLADFDPAELVTAILSYLLPLFAGVLVYVRLAPASPVDDRPMLRKRPWQSGRFIVSVIVIVAALIGGLSYGRLSGLPSVTLPSAR